MKDKDVVPEKEKTDDFAVVEVELSDEDFILLARMAHERDITFNQLINSLLRSWIDERLSKIANLE